MIAFERTLAYVRIRICPLWTRKKEPCLHSPQSYFSFCQSNRKMWNRLLPNRDRISVSISISNMILFRDRDIHATLRPLMAKWNGWPGHHIRSRDWYWCHPLIRFLLPLHAVKEFLETAKEEFEEKWKNPKRVSPPIITVLFPFLFFSPRLPR